MQYVPLSPELALVIFPLILGILVKPKNKKDKEDNPRLTYRMTILLVQGQVTS